MRLDFWNNPIVVSAFRVKYRRGGIFHFVALYMLLLVAGGAWLYYQGSPFVGLHWQQIYLVALLGVQLVISPLLAAVATSSSMKAEVVNRTLDYQRIAALSPSQILVGKLLGEPALAYLLAASTLPLAVWCFALGVPGLGPVELFLLYVNLATTTLMFGSVGLLNRLEIGEGKLSGGGAAGGWAWSWIVTSLWIALGTGARATVAPWYAVPGGLLAPLFAVIGLAKEENPWSYVAPLYGARVPFLLMTPLAQLVVAGVCFRTMVRRLINPLNTPLGKPTAYLLLALVDAFAVGLLFGPLRGDVGSTCAVFCAVHLLACLTLTVSITPGRETLQSWVWRLRGQTPRLWALWVGERSENILSLLMFSALGAGCFLLGLVLPTVRQHGWDAVRNEGAVILSAAALTLALTLALGTAYQWFQTFPVGRGGSGAFLTLAGFAAVLPHLVGGYYRWPWLLLLSPTAHFFSWTLPTSPINQPGELPIYPILILYSLVAVATWVSLRRRLGRYEKAVDLKLQQMGVVGK